MVTSQELQASFGNGIGDKRPLRLLYNDCKTQMQQKSGVNFEFFGNDESMSLVAVSWENYEATRKKWWGKKLVANCGISRNTSQICLGRVSAKPVTMRLVEP
jgi:hypothetical protein